MKLINSTTVQQFKFINYSHMNSEQLQQMIKWLNIQIMHLTESIKEAHQANNYGREIQYEGMRDAFKEFLNKFNSTKEEKLKFINKRTRNRI